MHHSVIYTDDDGKHFRFSGGTLAWRNHNPGNAHPGHISKKHNQIGIAYKLAVFPDYESGHEALLDVLKITYANSSIDEMMKSYAPPYENNTKKYIKFLHDVTGVKDNKKIKDFTPSKFEKLWKGIEKMESAKEGTVTQVFQVTKVCTNAKGVISSLCVNEDWVSKEQCIKLAKQGLVDLEVCTSHSGNTFLRTPPSTSFQEKLDSIIDKKEKT
jgi:hypothetical protein